jgi:trans-2-enoyl-CoA reductase
MAHACYVNALAASAAALRRVEVTSTDPGLTPSERVRVQTGARHPLKAGQVRVGMLVMAINPADLLQLDGRYGAQPVLPYVPGHEGVAVVLETAPDVADLMPGDHVLPMAPGGCWTDERVVARRYLVPVPAAADILQCAMLTANPATAWVLLRHMCALERGDWVIQNAANSAVGQCVRQLAPQLGLRVLNVVRRQDAVDEADRADSVWLVDAGSNPSLLRERVVASTQGNTVRLALDAIAGPASGALAGSLADKASLVVYGMLSGRPCEVSAHDLVFRELQVKGFWLATWFADADNRSKARTLYPELVAMVQAGSLKMAVEAVYPLDEVADALAHAARAGRSGKVLLTGAWMNRVTGSGD